jgi:hypothetical protein
MVVLILSKYYLVSVQCVGFVCLTSFNITTLSGNVNYFFQNFWGFFVHGLKPSQEKGLVNQLDCLPSQEMVGFCETAKT